MDTVRAFGSDLHTVLLAAGDGLMAISYKPEPDDPLLSQINATPLVDVLLVLLVMLIITIPIQLHSVNLEMPSASAPPPDTPEIHLRPDRSAKYDTVAGVLAAAQRHGLAKVGLVGSERFLR